jgi:hypothetical protein
MTTEAAQLLVVLCLSLAAFGFVRTCVLGVLAAGISVGLHFAGVPSWTTSGAAALGGLSWLVLFAGFIRKPAFIFIALVVVGGPAFLVWRFACHYSWTPALGLASYLALALPGAIFGLLSRSKWMKQKTVTPVVTTSYVPTHTASMSSYTSHAPVSYGRSEVRSGR